MGITCIYKVKLAKHTYVYKQTENDTLLEQVITLYSDNTNATLREMLLNQQIYADFSQYACPFLLYHRKQKNIRIKKVKE